MKLIPLIEQKDDTGCCIACVAMLGSKSYASVKKVLLKQENWSKRRKQLYTDTKQVVNLIQNVGLDPVVKIFKEWDELQGANIIAVNLEKDDTAHSVIALKTKRSFLIIDPAFAGIFHAEMVMDWEEGYMGIKDSSYIHVPGLNFQGIRI